MIAPRSLLTRCTFRTAMFLDSWMIWPRVYDRAMYACAGAAWKNAAAAAINDTNAHLGMGILLAGSPLQRNGSASVGVARQTSSLGAADDRPKRRPHAGHV